MPNSSAFRINTSLAPVSSRILYCSVCRMIDSPCSVNRRQSSHRLSDNTVHLIPHSFSLFLLKNLNVHLQQLRLRQSRVQLSILTIMVFILLILTRMPRSRPISYHCNFFLCFRPQGRCKPSAIELALIAEAPPVLTILFAKLQICFDVAKILLAGSTLLFYQQKTSKGQNNTGDKDFSVGQEDNWCFCHLHVAKPQPTVECKEHSRQIVACM